MTSSSFSKDPAAKLDYLIDWTAWLGPDDAIETSTWAVTRGDVVIESTLHEDYKAIVWLSGGTVSTTCKVTNTIRTLGGRTDERTLTFRVSDR